MRTIYTLLLLCFHLLLLNTAQAAVVHKDWKLPGDNLVSFEQRSGLDWLKLSATKGKTLSYVTTHLTDEFYGWRFPTVAEVRSMAEAQIGAAILAPAFNYGHSVSLTDVQRQIWYEFIGMTDIATASFGYVEPSNISGIYGVGLFPGGSFHNILYGEASKDGHNHTYFIGIYLVRDAVMDVSTPACFGALLILAGFLSRRKKSA